MAWKSEASGGRMSESRLMGLSGSANAVVSAVIDRIGLFQFVLPFRATFNRIGTKVKTGGGAGKKYGVALFDKDLNLVVETGALDANTAQVNITTVALTTVEPGVYYLGQTSDSTSTQCSAVQIGEHGSILAGLATKRRGHSTTSAPSPGTFPSTITLDTDSGFNPTIAIFARE